MATLTVYPNAKNGVSLTVLAEDLVTTIPSAGAVVTYSPYYQAKLASSQLVTVDPLAVGGVPVSLVVPDVAVTDAPTVGQVLKATSTSVAQWQDESGGVSADGDVAADATGAVFDNSSTDRTAALTTLLESMASVGGRLIAPRTTKYARLSDPVRVDGAVYSGIHVKGGKFKRTTNGAGSDYEGMLTFMHGPGSSDHVTDINIQDCVMEGNSSANDLSQAVQFGFSDRCVVDNVRFTGLAHEGIYWPGGSTFGKVTRCHAYDSGKWAAQPRSVYNPNCDMVIVAGNTCYDVGTFIEHTGRGAAIYGNLFEKTATTGRGLMLHSTSQPNELTNAFGNVLIDATNAIMVADQSSSLGKSLFTGNLLYRTGPSVNIGSKSTSGQPYIVTNNYLLHGKTTNEAFVIGTGGQVIHGNTIAKITGTTTGSITSGQTSLVVPAGATTMHDIAVGSTLTIAGVSGTKTVTAVSADRATITIDTSASATVASAAVTFTSAQWAYLFLCNNDDYNIIRDNTIIGLCWTTFFIYLRGMKTELINNVIQARGESLSSAYMIVMRDAPGTVPITHGQYLTGADFDATVPWSYGPRFCEITADAVPPALTWCRGAHIRKRNPAAGASPGWYCTQAGTAGTLNGSATTGGITSGQASLVVNSAIGLYPGCYITIAGVTGVKQVSSISGTTVTIDSNADATVAAAAVAYSAPIWKAEAAVAA